MKNGIITFYENLDYFQSKEKVTQKLTTKRRVVVQLLNPLSEFLHIYTSKSSPRRGPVLGKGGLDKDETGRSGQRVRGRLLVSARCRSSPV